MSTTAKTGSDTDNRGLRYSFVNSLLTPYWAFNVLEMAYVTIGMTLALPVSTGSWNWTVWGVAMVYIWLGSAGANNLDLADEGLTIDIDSTVQYTVGYAMLTAFIALGFVLAWLTTPLYIGIVVLTCVGALAYNLEWFGGRFHDRKYPTGIGNLGFTATFLPTLGGFLLVKQTVDATVLGAAFVAAGLTIIVCLVHYVEGDLKEYKYEMFGIDHDRDVEPDYERLERRAAKQQGLNILGTTIMGVGFALIFLV